MADYGTVEIIQVNFQFGAHDEATTIVTRRAETRMRLGRALRNRA
jgi:hypothetical protein